jgi:hypothetical protein
MQVARPCEKYLGFVQWTIALLLPGGLTTRPCFSFVGDSAGLVIGSAVVIQDELSRARIVPTRQH